MLIFKITLVLMSDLVSENRVKGHDGPACGSGPEACRQCNMAAIVLGCFVYAAGGSGRKRSKSGGVISKNQNRVTGSEPVMYPD